MPFKLRPFHRFLLLRFHIGKSTPSLYSMPPRLDMSPYRLGAFSPKTSPVQYVPCFFRSVDTTPELIDPFPDLFSLNNIEPQPTVAHEARE